MSKSKFEHDEVEFVEEGSSTNTISDTQAACEFNVPFAFTLNHGLSFIVLSIKSLRSYVF